MTTAQVRDAISDAIDGMSGMRCSAYLGQVNPPCAMVRRDEFDPRLVFSGVKAERKFTILVFHSRVNDRAGQVNLDAFVDSVKTTLEGDSALNALVEAGEIVRVGGEQIMEYGGAEYIGCEIELRVVY